ncbi:MAG: hypothetical protein AAF788_01230 [Pseudomonadota bacterium]
MKQQDLLERAGVSHAAILRARQPGRDITVDLYERLWSALLDIERDALINEVPHINMGGIDD